MTPFDHWSCRTNLLTILGSLSLSVAFDDDWADNAIRDSELQSQETIGQGKKRRNRDKQKGGCFEHPSW